MREIRPYGSEGGEAQSNGPSLPLSRRFVLQDTRPQLKGPDVEICILLWALLRARIGSRHLRLPVLIMGKTKTDVFT